MHRTAYLVALAASLILAPAADARIMRPGDGLRMAERAVPSKCAGRTTIIETTMMQTSTSLGEATGMVFDHPTGRWSTARCEFTVLPGLDPATRCRVEIHEYLHIALEQADHTGLLDPEALAKVTLRLCDPLPTPREELIDMIRERLPNPASWTIRCSKTSPRMTCRALRAGSKTRRYRAGIRGDEIMLSRR